MIVVRCAIVGFLLPLLIEVSGVGATTWSVDQGDPGCSDGPCAPCCTIQAAVEHSSGTDIVSVATGTYPEQVDIRDMQSIGDIVLEASAGPGTVLVTPASGRALMHADSHNNTVTIDGIDFTSPDMTCVFIAHTGDVVLQDVTAIGCGNHGFEIDATGTVSMTRCAGNDNGNKGIQVDSAASVTLTDCTASGNVAAGIHVLNVTGSVDLLNPIATENDEYGIGFDVYGPLTIVGGEATDNVTTGVWPWASGTVSIEGMTITGNGEQGIDMEGLDGVPVAGVVLTDTIVDNNGYTSGESGFRLRDVDGPVQITNCSFDGNGWDGFSPETSVVGNLDINGGHANGNADDGYDLRVVGDVTVTGVSAEGNADGGVQVDSQGLVHLEDSTANDNMAGGGIVVSWQDPEPVAGVTVVDCTANGNGLAGGADGVLLEHVVGPATVVGTTTNGNSGAGVRVKTTDGPVLVQEAVSSFGGTDGIRIEADGGPVTVRGCAVEGNDGTGIRIQPGTTGADVVVVKRNFVIDNPGTGLAYIGAAGPAELGATCNDIAGNGGGIYLDAPIIVDARHVWWGHSSGPSGQGAPGTGDSIYAEPGGTINFDPWLAESFAAPISGCPIFEAGFETGNLAEWDGSAP